MSFFRLHLVGGESDFLRMCIYLLQQPFEDFLDFLIQNPQRDLGVHSLLRYVYSIPRHTVKALRKKIKFLHPSNPDQIYLPTLEYACRYGDVKVLRWVYKNLRSDRISNLSSHSITRIYQSTLLSKNKRAIEWAYATFPPHPHMAERDLNNILNDALFTCRVDLFDWVVRAHTIDPHYVEEKALLFLHGLLFYHNMIEERDIKQVCRIYPTFSDLMDRCARAEEERKPTVLCMSSIRSVVLPRLRPRLQSCLVKDPNLVRVPVDVLNIVSEYGV